MQIKERQSGNITILELSGRIDIGVGAPQLRGTVREALESGKKNLLLDLVGVSSVDSSGLGELISSFTATQQQGGKLKLVRVPQKLLDLLMITKLITVFEVFDTEAEAVTSFA